MAEGAPVIYHNVCGIVHWFNRNKRFGFILSDYGDLFVHANNIMMRPPILKPGQSVTFDICDAPKGLHAIDVVLSEERQPQGRSRSSTTPRTSNSSSVVNTSSSIPKQGRGESHSVELDDDGNGFDTERFESDVPKELVCAVCHGVLNSPYQTKCEHLFCRQCIERWLDENPNPSCPIDRERLARHDLQPAPRFVKSMIGGLKLKCDFADLGCKSVVTIDELVSHRTNCPYRRQKKRAHGSGRTRSSENSNVAPLFIPSVHLLNAGDSSTSSRFSDSAEHVTNSTQRRQARNQHRNRVRTSPTVRDVFMSARSFLEDHDDDLFVDTFLPSRRYDYLDIIFDDIEDFEDLAIQTQVPSRRGNSDYYFL